MEGRKLRSSSRAEAGHKQQQQQQQQPFKFKLAPEEPEKEKEKERRKEKKARKTKTKTTTKKEKKKITTIPQTDCKIPDQILQNILGFIPDNFNFSPSRRTRDSSYGFTHHPHPMASTQPSSDESEGLHWTTPPTQLRFVNKQWARVAAEVFFKHISITTISRLESLVKLFNSNNPYLPSVVRTIAISFDSNQAQRIKSHQSIRDLFSQLFSQLTSLRSLSIRACSPALLFPAPLQIEKLFLPLSIIRLAVEFQSDDHPALLGSVNISTYQLRPLQLHSAELNLLLVSLPNLRSLHLSKFQSLAQKPLSRYLLRPEDSQNDPPRIDSEKFPTIQSLILSDCHLSEPDSQFISVRFPGLRSLVISNQFINPKHITSINHLLASPSTPPSPHPRHPRLANSLENLTLKLDDFHLEPAQIIHAFLQSLASSSAPHPNSMPGSCSASSLASSLSDQHEAIDLSQLGNLKHLSIVTPTRVAFTSPSGRQDSSVFETLESLELDRRLVFNPHQADESHVCASLCSLKGKPERPRRPFVFGAPPLGPSEGGHTQNPPLTRVRVVGDYLAEPRRWAHWWAAADAGPAAPPISDLPPYLQPPAAQPVWLAQLGFQLLCWDLDILWD